MRKTMWRGRSTTWVAGSCQPVDGVQELASGTHWLPLATGAAARAQSEPAPIPQQRCGCGELRHPVPPGSPNPGTDPGSWAHLSATTHGCLSRGSHGGHPGCSLPAHPVRQERQQSCQPGGPGCCRQHWCAASALQSMTSTHAVPCLRIVCRVSLCCAELLHSSTLALSSADVIQNAGMPDADEVGATQGPEATATPQLVLRSIPGVQPGQQQQLDQALGTGL